MRGILTFAFFGVDAYIALALVDGRGLTATQAGISLTAATITWTAGSWVQARYATRISPERFIGMGLPVVILGLTGFTAVLHPAITPWLSIPTVAIAGLRHGPGVLADHAHRAAPGGAGRTGHARRRRCPWRTRWARPWARA